MPLQHQEHETGHDQRLQSTVARIIATTRDALKPCYPVRLLRLDRVNALDAGGEGGAINRTVNADKIRTGDLGGNASTHAFAEAVAKRV